MIVDSWLFSAHSRTAIGLIRILSALTVALAFVKFFLVLATLGCKGCTQKELV